MKITYDEFKIFLQQIKYHAKFLLENEENLDEIEREILTNGHPYVDDEEIGFVYYKHWCLGDTEELKYRMIPKDIFGKKYENICRRSTTLFLCN